MNEAVWYEIIEGRDVEIRNLRAELDRTKGDMKVALADLVAVYDAEAAGVAQQVTKPERIAAARAVGASRAVCIGRKTPFLKCCLAVVSKLSIGKFNSVVCGA